MAALPGLSTHGANGDRRKKSVVTYGKPSRNTSLASSNTKAFFDTQDTTPPKSKLKRVPSSVAKKSHTRFKDDFDLSSSSEEDLPAPRSIKQPTKATINTSNANSTRVSGNTVSPYKRKRTSSHTSVAKSSTKSLEDPVKSTARQNETEAAQPRRSKRQAGPATSSNTDSRHDLEPDSKPTPLPTIFSCPISPSLDLPDSPNESSPSVSTTPKQTKLWHELLQSDPPESIFDQPHPGPPDASRPLTPSHLRRAKSDNSHMSAARRGRLVDRLKHTVKRESSESSDSGSHRATNTVSPAKSQASFSQPAQQKAHSQPQLPPKHASLSQGGSSHRVTYGPSRTYLQESLEDMIFGDTPIAEFERPSAPMRRTGASSKAIVKPRERQKDDSDDDGHSQGIKSIHELRAAGVKNGFLDDVVRLMDDIKDPKPIYRSRRRSALMELAQKLTDKEFTSRFIEHGFYHDLVNQFEHATTDVIANITLCVVLIRLCRGDMTESFSTPLLSAGALDFLTSCFKDTTKISQIVRDRKHNMSKIAQSDFVDFCESVRTSDLWPLCVPEYLSLRFVALRSTELLILAHRRGGNSGSVLSSESATTLVGMLSDANPVTDNVTQITTNMLFSALEAASTLDVLDHTMGIWSVNLVSRIASVLSSMLHMPKSSQALALRLCLNVTNGHSQNSNTFAETNTIHMIMGYIAGGFGNLQQRKEEDSNSALDNDLLILALALMLNLTEYSDSAREKASLDIEYGANVLVDNFIQGRERLNEVESEEEMQRNVAYGYLAILLANMCQDLTVRAQICARLPKQSLSVLEEAANEFLLIHQKVDSQMLDENEGGELAANFTQRLSGVVGRLRDSGK